MKKTSILIISFLTILLLASCSKPVTDEQTSKIEYGMDTSRAIKILGEGKVTTDTTKINSVLENERNYLQSQIDDDDLENLSYFYKEKLNLIEVAQELVDEGYEVSLHSYKYKGSDSDENFYLITYEEKDDDIVVTSIFD